MINFAVLINERVSVSLRNHRTYRSKFVATLLYATLFVVAAACSATRHVPDDELLLDKVSINITDNDTIVSDELINYLRQAPNHKVLGFAKLQLGLYNLSGKDDSKWYNRWLKRIGQPPVIYDSSLTDASRRQLTTALVNRGFMDAEVTVDTVVKHDKKKIEVTYNVTAGTPHTISSLTVETDDPRIEEIIARQVAPINITPGMMFDRNALDAERTRIASVLRNNGYYSFSKESITFLADTAAGSNEIDLTMTVRPPHTVKLSTGEEIGPTEHQRYAIKNVIFVTDYDGRSSGMNLDFPDADTVRYKDITILYGPDRYLRPSILDEKCFIRTGEFYNATDVDRTYSALSRLGILRFINIEMKPIATIDGTVWMDAYILLSRNKKQSVSVQVEGTNSEGDLGFGVGVTYQHRNLARRSELFTAKFRTSYESLSGNFEGLVNDRYTEYAGEADITFPKFMAPFLSHNFKMKSSATTQFALSVNYQERPEYTRVIAGGAWKYKWSDNRFDFNRRRTFDLIDINYVYLPRSTFDFINQIAPDNPLLRYSYEDHFIMRLGYTYSMTNRRIPTSERNSFSIQPSVTTFRWSAEMAGNVLYAISKMIGQKKNDGAYKVFGIQYAQYVKAEADYSYTRFLTNRQAIAVHGGAGIAYPYGNSSMVPFEKRFYAGGSNGVRGWSARTLGPGAYDARNQVIDFINQCGDIKLDFSFEYRFKLFWVFEGALFVDAGNIWTIKNYVNQPGGLFRFKNFYKEIAASYGAGIRMDFTYFLLRFDLGMKAHNPAMNQEPWPIVHPKWGRDATFHFAVGYPF